MAKSSKYWQDRFKELEDDAYKSSQKHYEDIQKQFRMANNSLQADISSWYYRVAENNDISYSKAKRFLGKKDVQEFHWTVEEYIKYGRENALNQKWMKELENASSRVHISWLETLNLQAQQEIEKLFCEYENSCSDFLGKLFQSQYYHTAYEIAKGTGILSAVPAIDVNKIQTILAKPWAQDGKNFSSRIWANKEKLIQELHTELAQQIIRGSDPQRAINAIAKKMNVSRSQAGNLVMTESAAISNVAQQQCFKDLGVEEFEVVATLDIRTSEICREMDGKHFPMSDYKIGVTSPPFHCRCRSCTCPWFDDEFTEGEQRAYRGEDGKTHYTDDMSYEEWHKKYVDGLSSGSNNPVVNKITDKDIDRVPLMRAGSMTDDEAVKLQQAHRDILSTAEANESIEVGRLMDGNMNTIDTVIGTATSIDLNVPGRGKATYVIHNHPNNASFSNRDVIWLMKNDSVKYFSIVKNNGAVEILHIPDTFDRAKFETEYGRLCKKFQKDIANNKQKGYDKVIQNLLTRTKSGLEYVR